jgi:hypothetical protein
MEEETFPNGTNTQKNPILDENFQKGKLNLPETGYLS